jgi:hypothetical protein
MGPEWAVVGLRIGEIWVINSHESLHNQHDEIIHQLRVYNYYRDQMLLTPRQLLSLLQGCFRARGFAVLVNIPLSLKPPY